LIQNNNPERFEVKANIDKKLIGLVSAGIPPQQMYFETNAQESSWVAGEIKARVKSQGYRYKDFALLVRSNSDAQPYLQSLNLEDIPWQFSGSQGLYSRGEVKLCISFLRVISNPSDSLHLYYLASSAIYMLDLADLALSMHYARRRNKTLYSVFSNLKGIEELSSIGENTQQKMGSLIKDIEKFMEISRHEATGRVLYRFLTETGYLKKLTCEQSLENEEKIQNIAKFFNIVRDFEIVAREDRVINFTNYLNLLIEAGDDPATVETDLDTDAVNVLTIHKAKGLEFRIVFLVSLVNGRFPLPRRRQTIELPDPLIKEILPEGDFHIQEERRLFYVGMTRAKEVLYMTSALDYGGQRTRRVSQFVIEALGEEAKQREKSKEGPLESIRHFAPQGERPQAKKYPIGDDKILNLSYYQIDDYLTCPLKYKYVNILRVPIMEHHTVIYGRAVHDAICKYFSYRLANRDMELPELLDAFNNSFDPQGFLDEEHQQERFRIGKEALVRFYDSEIAKPSKPAYIEKSFSFILGKVKITGRFDRVDIEESGAVIIDFKTSEINRQADADRRTRESLQLLLYALAYKNIAKQLPKRVELHFLESGLIGKAAVEKEGLNKISEKIKEVSGGIRRQDFNAMANYISCAYCAYNQICPSATLK